MALNTTPAQRRRADTGPRIAGPRVPFQPEEQS
jgi:hypothetical protein